MFVLNLKPLRLTKKCILSYVPKVLEENNILLQILNI